MTNVVPLFGILTPRRPLDNERQREQEVAKSSSYVGDEKASAALTAEAGRLASAVRALSSIEGQEVRVLQSMTYRNELELTKNMEKAIKLLLRFAKELKLHVDQENHRTSESA